ncbi:16S rRNA (cytidine(1402)-2'-O)-methyltransferase [Marinobacter sp. R17]|uniref:16S rRNA (cytidine(1402)-2'-O)-methyltransferase n=1 Tax=Marinobacter sp. R17 TaxID=2484250 RepID=UPI000F4CC189|nr:16S rRNA (cytidine(1402)-2'-O)-methyltransferase [Marinobacter sp. R17]ROT96207.1 16S rRNA (cytidine(1402)-2'-O)-methyltransferase [Marinobacter sp. R17]
MPESAADCGLLYIVATPIGNLGDISQRAADILARVDCIAAEDTRHTQRLLQVLGLHRPLVALHEHNERERHESVLQRLRQGESVALVSDAGTPLISDPGFILVRAAREQGLTVVPIPGPCAITTALSAAGLPTDRFTFEGFLPTKRKARLDALKALRHESRTLVFYEAPHRIRETAVALAEAFGAERSVVLARELTKAFETFYSGTAGDVVEQLAEDDYAEKGEYVVMVAGAPASSEDAATEIDPDELLTVLLREVPVKVAARMASELTGLSRNELYQRALALKA